MPRLTRSAGLLQQLNGEPKQQCADGMREARAQAATTALQCFTYLSELLLTPHTARRSTQAGQAQARLGVTRRGAVMLPPRSVHVCAALQAPSSGARGAPRAKIRMPARYAAALSYRACTWREQQRVSGLSCCAHCARDRTRGRPNTPIGTVRMLSSVPRRHRTEVPWLAMMTHRARGETLKSTRARRSPSAQRRGGSRPLRRRSQSLGC